MKGDPFYPVNLYTNIMWITLYGWLRFNGNLYTNITMILVYGKDYRLAFGSPLRGARETRYVYKYKPYICGVWQLCLTGFHNGMKRDDRKVGERNTIYKYNVYIFLEKGPRFGHRTIPTYYHFSPQKPTFLHSTSARGNNVWQVGIPMETKATIKT